MIKKEKWTSIKNRSDKKVLFSISKIIENVKNFHPVKIGISDILTSGNFFVLLEKRSYFNQSKLKNEQTFIPMFAMEIIKTQLIKDIATVQWPKAIGRKCALVVYLRCTIVRLMTKINTHFFKQLRVDSAWPRRAVLLKA